jgi:uncharacterized protein (TIGR02444 family)
VEFWQFANDLYRRAGVEDACLWLQDNADLDVAMLLMCCWLGSRNTQIAPGALATLVAQSQPWQRELIQPLRRARRWWRQQHGDNDVYQQLKTLELAAERQFIEWLQAQVQTLPASDLLSSDNAQQAARNNLQRYCQQADIAAKNGSKTDFDARMATLLQALGA